MVWRTPTMRSNRTEADRKLRPIAEPFVVAAPAGTRIRTGSAPPMRKLRHCGKSVRFLDTYIGLSSRHEFALGHFPLPARLSSGGSINGK